MKKIITGMERDFLLETLIKKAIPLTCEDNQQCILTIISKEENQLLGVVQSSDALPPRQGIYTATLDAIRLLKLELAVKGSYSTFQTFFIPTAIEVLELSQAKQHLQYIQITCTFEGTQIDLSGSNPVPVRSPHCIVFSSLHEPDLSMITPCCMSDSMLEPLSDASHSFPALSAIARNSKRVLYFDSQEGIPEKDVCIGTKLLTRSDFESLVINALTDTKIAIKNELKLIAHQSISLCLYPAGMFHNQFVDVFAWRINTIRPAQLSMILHIIDALSLSALSIPYNAGTILAGIFIHGILVVSDKKYKKSVGTCIVMLPKRTIRGTITLDQIAAAGALSIYYGSFSSLEPEDFRFLAEYIVARPLLESDFETDEIQTLCIL